MNCTITAAPPSEPWLAGTPALALEWFDRDRTLVYVLVGERVLAMLAAEINLTGIIPVFQPAEAG